MLIIDDWLEDRLPRYPRVPIAAKDPSEFAMMAGALRAQAEADGYKAEDLVTACGGDIASYLMTRCMPSLALTEMTSQSGATASFRD